MKVGQLKINGMSNPIGFSYEKLRCSWKVWDTNEKIQKGVCIVVSDDISFTSIYYSKEGKDLNSTGESLEMKCKPHTRYYYRVIVNGHDGEKAISEPAFFETGKMAEPWHAQWIGTVTEDQYHPVFIRNLQIAEKIKNARLYISGLGLYEAYINEVKVGDEVLAPLYSDYHTQVQYQTYDITQMLAMENKISIYLGNGWYKGRFGLGGTKENFGSAFITIAEIYLEKENGEIQIIGTDDTWQYQGSNIETSDIYDGEIYNRLLWEDKENALKKAELMGDLTGKLVERYSLPVKEQETMPVKELIYTPAGELVLDFGQNFTGYVKFLSEQPKGTKVTLDFGEILQNGNFYNDNYRSAKSQFVYISDGTKELIYPHFTFFGFRYVRVEGWVGDFCKEDFFGKAVYSDMEITGFIETGNVKVNQLISNCMWGQKSNSLDFPTDCPQRDERLAWTGDAQMFSGTACYNMDTRAFYHKFLHDLRVEQNKYEGIMPGVIPVFDPRGPICCSVWGDIATFLPTVLYQRFGDKEALLQYYPMMKDWVNYINREDEKRGRRFLFDFGNHIGDWLALDGRTAQSMKGGTDDYFIASCYYAASVKKVSDAAEILGFQSEAQEYNLLYEKIRTAILAEYYSITGRLSVDTQTAYLVALDFGIYKDVEKVKEGLRNRLFNDCYKIKGGFVGAPIMCRVLAEHGFEEEAFYFLLQEDFPGWIHCINLGATTIWERWNSVLDNGLLSGTMMNSLNHYAFGSVVEYIYRDIAGIQPLEPGFKKVRIAPQVNQKLGFVKLRYDSVYGTYRSQWKICKDGTIEVHIEIPFNCTAVVQLPHYEEKEIELDAGNYDFKYQPLIDCTALFTRKTFFKDMLYHKSAREIIKETLPQLNYFLENKDIEFLNENLDTLKRLHFMGFQEDKIEEAAKKLMHIRME